MCTCSSVCVFMHAHVLGGMSAHGYIHENTCKSTNEVVCVQLYLWIRRLMPLKHRGRCRHQGEHAGRVMIQSGSLCVPVPLCA